MRLQVRKNRHATRKRTRGRKKRDFQATAQGSGIQQVGFSRTARAFLRLCRTGSFILRKRLFGITGKALPLTRKGFSAQEKSVRRAPEAKKMRIFLRIMPAQHMLRHFSGAAASPHRVRFFPPTHCNTSCINIHKKPSQQAACHLPASAPARRRPASADIRKA